MEEEYSNRIISKKDMFGFAWAYDFLALDYYLIPMFVDTECWMLTKYFCKRSVSCRKPLEPRRGSVVLERHSVSRDQNWQNNMRNNDNNNGTYLYSTVEHHNNSRLCHWAIV